MGPFSLWKQETSIYSLQVHGTTVFQSDLNENLKMYFQKHAVASQLQRFPKPYSDIGLRSAFCMKNGSFHFTE